jgi:hypothetical protein
MISEIVYVLLSVRTKVIRDLISTGALVYSILVTITLLVFSLNMILWLDL